MFKRYRRLRLNYLKEHKKAEYTILFMKGKLNKHLKISTGNSNEKG